MMKLYPQKIMLWEMWTTNEEYADCVEKSLSTAMKEAM
jgi:hypothetical protein